MKEEEASKPQTNKFQSKMNNLEQQQEWKWTFQEKIKCLLCLWGESLIV